MSYYAIPDCEMVKNTAVYGLIESFKRAKFPMSVDIEDCENTLTDTIRQLGRCSVGSGHDQFLTGIEVQFDVSGTIKWWTEAERYHFLNYVSSQSTMHRISQFNIGAKCVKWVDPVLLNIVESHRLAYENNPTPENYLKLLYNIPVGMKLTAGMTTNYRQLKTIYYQRKNHRLPEWREFCKWIVSLPYFKELCLGDNNESL